MSANWHLNRNGKVVYVVNDQPATYKGYKRATKNITKDPNANYSSGGVVISKTEHDWKLFKARVKSTFK